jgi:hypothetical protein
LGWGFGVAAYAKALRVLCSLWFVRVVIWSSALVSHNVAIWKRDNGTAFCDGFSEDLSI